MKLFTGLHQPSDAKHFDAAFVSVNRLRRRRIFAPAGEWIMDSGAFTEIATHGAYRSSPDDYAGEIRRWSKVGKLVAAVSQDWMCEPWIVKRTGLSVEQHQRLTIERFDALRACDTAGVYVMPVLQGYTPTDYRAHLGMYGERLGAGAWVGVGSVCKRNGTPSAVESVLLAIHEARPDLRLHGFGLKATALASGVVQQLIASADSMAWSYSARKHGRNANDWREARRWSEQLTRRPVQHLIPGILVPS